MLNSLDPDQADVLSGLLWDQTVHAFRLSADDTRSQSFGTPISSSEATNEILDLKYMHIHDKI